MHEMEIPANLPLPFPIRQDSLKIAEPAASTEHVERVESDPDNGFKNPDAHWIHLPGGVQESAAEKQNKWFIGSIDCGTTSARFIVFNGSGMPVASHQVEFESIYPQSG